MFDFPNSPSEGTQFAPTGGPVYVYTGGVWRMQGSGQVVTAEARNRIVNPAMQISQENARTASNAINYYPADQWRTAGSGPVLSSASVASPTPGIDPYHSYLNCTTAKPSLAAGDYYIATQTIEGIRLADFGWGTANAKPIVVRLVLMTNFTGTYCLSIRTASSDRSYVVPFTVDSTYSEKVVAIPGDTGGTWPTDTSAGLLFSICACAGTTYQTATPNVWQSGNFLATTTQTNLAAATSQLIRYSHVGLYLDPNATGVPPPWQMPDEAQELAACQRYWQTLTWDFQSIPSGGFTLPWWLSAWMRTNPAIGVRAAGSVSNITGISEGARGPSSGYFQCTVGAGGGTIYNRVYAMTARM